jgi:LysM repeat protein
MLKNRQLSFGLMLGLSAALVLSACTRPATTDTVLPTETPLDGSGGGGNPDQAATDAFVTNMNATLIAGNTQTAEAILGSGTGGGDGLVGTVTPTAPVINLPTATPAAIDVAPATAVPVAPTNPSQYTVKPGDWLYKIARDLGVSPHDLIAANPQINPNAVLQPGTVLNVPGAGAPGTGGGDSGGAKTYTVVLGDNLFRIALNHGTTFQILAQMNNIPAPYTVYPGQVINLP